MKKCRICNKNKPKDSYTFRKDTEKYRTECKQCLNEKRKKQPSYGKWHKNNKDHLKIYERGYRLVRRYGISYVQYFCILDQQEHKCAICKTDNPKGKGQFHVDHCHSTGKVRGLLCSDCNPALGQFKDDVSLLKEAIKYLEKNK